jgi:hypothetical protein
MIKEEGISLLKGRTIERVSVSPANDEIVFVTTDGKRFRMYHEQDCCEHVEIEDITGDIQSLIGQEVLEAYESSNSDEPPAYESDESYTWTFYRLRTARETVVIRWYGVSNGFYSESVSFVEDDNA